MFDSSRPPLLVQPVNAQQTNLFPSHEGYNIHFLPDGQALVSYKDGWTFPLSMQQQKLISAPPLLLVRSKGRVTSAGSTFSKGYAHQFCQENGEEPIYVSQQAVFPEQPDVQWMLIQDTVTMLWLQYCYKMQYCGDSGFDVEKNYYGKLIIRKYIIQEDFAPRLDKYADLITHNAKQYRVASHDFYCGSWDEKDKSPEQFMRELLSSLSLAPYQSAMAKAIEKANTPT